MSSVNNFKTSRTLEDFSDNNWIAPARNRDPARWRAATDDEQKRGIDYWLKIGEKWFSFEVKTENYPENYFVELYQIVESRRSFELGYAYKCEADFLVLSNLLGLFAIVVPREAFLTHAIDAALLASGTRNLSLVVNAKKDVVERAAIGIALPYVHTLESFKGPWSLIDFNFVSSHAAAVHFVADSLWYLKNSALLANEVANKMNAGRTTFSKLSKLQNRSCGSRHLEKGLEHLAGIVELSTTPAIRHRQAETFKWVQKGLVTGQTKFAQRFTESYTFASKVGAPAVALRVRGTQAARAKEPERAEVA